MSSVMLPSAATASESPILVVDDDAKIVGLVRAYLEREGYSVITAADGMAALKAIRRFRPQLVVLDLMLPELDGLAVLRMLREDSDLPVMMLSARGSAADRVLGIHEGADDYLPKPFSPAELVVRVKAILRRVNRPLRSRANRQPLEYHDIVIDRDRHEVHRAGRALPLTVSEFRMLVALVEADGRVLTRQMLLDAIYGAAEGGALERTIDVHVGRLRDKLGDVADQPRYIATVRGAGYRILKGASS